MARSVSGSLELERLVGDREWITRQVGALAVGHADFGCALLAIGGWGGGL